MSISSVGAWPRKMWRPMKRIVERLPMMKTLDLMYMASPMIGRTVTRIWYQHMTRMDKKAEMVFMNYGYADLDAGCTGLELATADEEDRYCIQLYHHVAGAVSIEGHDVLEVGCGRGGGASYVARYLKPNSMTGIDIAAKAVEFCRRHYSAANLSFEHGDAEALPFEDGSFDTVVNVESSHCYASMPRFLAEVRRALRPGGWLLLADRRDRNGIGTLRNQLVNAGFEVVREKRITDNILRALDLDEERKQALIRRGVPWFLRNMFRQFAATRGTSLYNSFDKGGWEYFSFVLRKTEAAD
jgi:ubiquinone/menaquinone biosynthesis C-methylase UbiE